MQPFWATKGSDSAEPAGSPVAGALRNPNDSESMLQLSRFYSTVFSSPKTTAGKYIYTFITRDKKISRVIFFITRDKTKNALNPWENNTFA